MTSFSEKIANFLGNAKNMVKKVAVPMVATLGAVLYNRHSYGLVDVPETARYMSQMYLSDPNKFADKLKSVEFYKMYNSYKQIRVCTC